MSELVRLNKYLSSIGVCSRRAADAAIEANRVTVNGQIATMGLKVDGTEEIIIDGKKIDKTKDDFVLIAFNKPKGVVCTAAKNDKNNIVDYIDYPCRIYPVGRLDKDSHGLILLTNEGDLVNKIMRASNYHEKEYIVKVNKEITSDFIKKMSEGVYLEELDTVTRKYVFSMILTQGLNMQIRRMCSALDYTVFDLKRIRIMNINIEGIKEGTYRDVSSKELDVLKKMIEGSKN